MSKPLSRKHRKTLLDIWQGSINAMSKAQEITAASITDSIDNDFAKKVVFSFGPVAKPTIRLEKS